MEFIKNKYLFFPFIVAGAVLAADSVFGIKSLEDMRMHWMKIEPQVYESREKVFENLKKEWPDLRSKGIRTGIILGSSRSAEYSSDAIAEVFPSSVTYNFSAPIAPPSHYYYWTDRILNAGIRPAFVIIEADALVFTRDSVNYSLAYSYDPLFMLSNTDFLRETAGPGNIWKTDAEGFSLDETETFFLKRLFSLYRYPLDPGIIRENQKQFLILSAEGFRVTTGFEFREILLNNINDAVVKNRGGIPNMMRSRNHATDLEQNAKEIFDRFNLGNYRASPAQVAFFRRLTRRLAKTKTAFAVNMPLMSDALGRMTEQSDSVQEFHRGLRAYIQELKAEFPDSVIILTDYQKDPDFTCRDFTDSYHLSGACHADLGKRILKDLISQNGGL